MAAKGPKTYMDGITVKGKNKNEEIDFDDFMKVISEQDETENEIQPPKLVQPDNVEVSQDKEQLSSTEEVAQFINNLAKNQNEQQFIQVTAPKDIPQEEVNESVPDDKEEILTEKKVYKINPNLPFNQQQPRKNFTQKIVDDKQSEILQEQAFKDEIKKESNDEEVDTNIILEQSSEKEINQGRLSKIKNNEAIKDSPYEEPNNKKSKKQKKQKKNKSEKGKNIEPKQKNKSSKNNNKKISLEEKLKNKGFPKKYYDPTDAETDDNGIEDYYFNIEKTLRKNNLLWITKIIPLDFLDRITYDKKIFDNHAKKQHKKAIELNNSSSSEQYQYENRNKIIKFLSISGFSLLIVFFVIFKVIPNNNYNNALDYYAEEDWNNAYNSFIDLGNYKNSKYYGKYSEAMKELNDKKFDDAKKNFKLLLDYKEYFNVSIQDAIYNCDYQKGIKLYSEGKFEEAMSLFSSIPDFQDATNYYYKCGYEIADTYYENGDMENALDSFYKVKAYEDSNERLSEIAEQMYSSAKTDYDNQNYDNALTLFKYLAKYNYKDSKSMIEQCQYRGGLNKYNSGEYEESRKLFSEVLSYKDSNAMYKECTYKIAKIKYAQSIEDSLQEYLSVKEYRDIPSILKQSVFVLYGEWNITEMNGSKTTPVTFTFNKNGLFQTNKQVLYTAISTDATPISYKWNGEVYATEDGKYTLSAKAESYDKIKLTCTEPGKTVEFTCERTKNYLDVINNVDNKDKVENDNTDDNESTNKTLTDILQNYVDKKTDGTVIIKDKEYNCLLIIQGINDNVGTPKSSSSKKLENSSESENKDIKSESKETKVSEESETSKETDNSEQSKTSKEVDDSQETQKSKETKSTEK